QRRENPAYVADWPTRCPVGEQVVGKLSSDGHLIRLPQAELESYPKVVLLPVDAMEHLGLAHVPCSSQLPERADPSQVPPLRGGLLTEPTQPLPAVLAERIQQPVAGSVAAMQLALEDRLVHQRPEEVHDLLGWQPRVGADVDRRVLLKSAREDRDPG